MNDLIDAKQDRLHPKKRSRPLAAGTVSQEAALALMNVGAQVLLGLGAVWLGYTLAYVIWR